MRTSSAMADGTVLMSVTSFFAVSVGRYSAFSARMIFPPALHVTKISNTDKSKQIEVDSSTPASSCGVKTLFAQ